MKMSEKFSNKRPFNIGQVKTYFEKIVIPELQHTASVYKFNFLIENELEIAFDTEDVFHIRRGFSMPYYSPDHILDKFRNLVKDYKEILPFIWACTPSETEKLILESIKVGCSVVNTKEYVFYIIFNVQEEFKYLFDGGHKICLQENLN